MTDDGREATPVMDGLWKVQEDGQPKLIGSRCTSCGEVFFPKKEMNFCAHCHKNTVSEIAFSGAGRLIAFTKVERQPAGGFYKGKVPYLYGIVQLEEGVNIYSHLIEDSSLAIGGKVELVIDKFYEEADYRDVMIFKFQAKQSLEGMGRDE
ncbi:Zn-ribbon domain-containing OB-fold protein [Sporosarcina koreensis]|uniref:Zn-ribbon domain-containing OB-fold protein n=1 Tax=Sporosarcina koreensis TaxID=334735 RepID=A0ABW0U3A7_9BACL